MAELADVSPEACDRCGNYAPVTRSFELALCADCVRKSVHEIARTPLDFQHVVKGIGQLFVRVGLPAGLFGIAIELPHAIAAQYVAVPTMLDFGWTMLTTLLSDLVALHLGWQVIRGRRSIDVRAALAATFESLPRALMTRIVMTLQIGLLSLLLIVPGIWRATVLYLALPISVFENKLSREALPRSVRLMKEPFWLGLGVGALMFVPALVLGGSTTAVAIAADVLAQPAEPPAWSLLLAFAGDLLASFTLVPMTLAPLVIYAKLAPPAPDLR